MLLWMWKFVWNKMSKRLKKRMQKKSKWVDLNDLEMTLEWLFNKKSSYWTQIKLNIQLKLKDEEKAEVGFFFFKNHKNCKQNASRFKTDSITLWLMDITGASMIPDLPNFPKVKPGIISKNREKLTPLTLLVVKSLHAQKFLMITKGTIGEKIDGKFRKIYPAVFGFFNVVYWFTYLKGK